MKKQKYLRKSSELINKSHPDALSYDDKQFIIKAKQVIELIKENDIRNSVLKLVPLIKEAEERYNKLDNMMVGNLKFVYRLLEDESPHDYINRLACIHTLKQIIQVIVDNEKVTYDENTKNRIENLQEWFNKEDSDIREIKDKYFEEKK